MFEPSRVVTKVIEDKVRVAWDDREEKWYFSIVNVCEVLTDSDYQAARKYWKVLKGRLKKEGNETVTNCYQLKMLAPDGGAACGPRGGSPEE